MSNWLDDLAEEVNVTSHQHGFWDHDMIDCPQAPHKNPSIIGEKLALIHSEVSEALEATRDSNAELLMEELADVIIRVLDLSVEVKTLDGPSIGEAVRDKMAKNTTREYLHGHDF